LRCVFKIRSAVVPATAILIGVKPARPIRGIWKIGGRCARDGRTPDAICKCVLRTEKLPAAKFIEPNRLLRVSSPQRNR
jgi:hypothetical protein